MTGKGLLKRILLSLVVACGVLLFLAALDANATPIRPNIRKLVSEPQQNATAQSMPARAGWDGPEMSTGQSSPMLPLFTRREAVAGRRELVAAATPDPRAILGIAAVIFLLRLLRWQEKKHALSVPAAPLSITAGNAPASPLEDDRRIAA